MGKRIVITTFGSLGDIYPYLGLARELQRRGHTPIFATSAYYRQLVEGAGVSFSPVRPDVDLEDRTTIRRLMDPKCGAEILIRERILAYLPDTYADLVEATRGADLLVTHPITFAGPILAERHQVPWVSTVLSPLSFFSVHDLPIFPNLPWLSWACRLGPQAGRVLKRLGKWMTWHWTDSVRQLRANFELPPGADPLYEGQFSPGLTLALFSSLLAAPQPDWPPHTQITGFSFYQDASDLPSELAQFLDSGPAPLVFTLGSSAVNASGTFYVESLAAVRRLGHRAVLLVGTDPHNCPAELLPAGVMAVPYAPHAMLFPRALAIIHHGGVGTTGQALRAGRPMLVVPYAFDQPDNAFRVTKLGVARTLFAKAYKAQRVVEQLRALLENDHYTQRAAEVGSMVRAEHGTEQASDAIETYLRRLQGVGDTGSPLRAAAWPAPPSGANEP